MMKKWFRLKKNRFLVKGFLNFGWSWQWNFTHRKSLSYSQYYLLTRTKIRCIFLWVSVAQTYLLPPSFVFYVHLLVFASPETILLYSRSSILFQNNFLIIQQNMFYLFSLCFLLSSVITSPEKQGTCLTTIYTAILNWVRTLPKKGNKHTRNLWSHNFISRFISRC